MSPVRIVIIAKAPIPGFCKTRLIPALGATGAAELAHRMLNVAVNAALASDVGPVELCVSPGLDEYDWSALDLPGGLTWSGQGIGDLGARMARAAQRATSDGAPVVLMGTDCPSLDSGMLRRASAALLDHDASLIPAEDGGYTLLGLQRFDETLFEHMPWSTPGVAAETRRRIARLGWRLCELPPLHDIDEPQDLPRLPAAMRAELPAHLRSTP
ncbi:TIGR04282 family arsenosugar biosynthesis glycosyltransferase [Paracidovorax sp. MALMAid1276]|uniref:TIGR04282 family arsenosugar biosynthesis glycosyltransferase n=1 Tax=Paracidovorax sp. MALMAid1276 TaxID=3411631 RepID=UPI003B9A3DCC